MICDAVLRWRQCRVCEGVWTMTTLAIWILLFPIALGIFALVWRDLATTHSAPSRVLPDTDEDLPTYLDRMRGHEA